MEARVWINEGISEEDFIGDGVTKDDLTCYVFQVMRYAFSKIKGTFTVLSQGNAKTLGSSEELGEGFAEIPTGAYNDYENIDMSYISIRERQNISNMDIQG